MGNVNETQEKKGLPLHDGLSESPGSESAPEFDDTDSVSSSVLDRDALGSDLPIKLFFPPRSSSELGADEFVVESPTSFEEEHTVEPDEDLPKDDSFPLSESALPSSFDLLVEASPNPSDNSDTFHTPDISVDGTEENPVTCFQSSPGVAMELFFPSTNSDDVGHVPKDSPVQPSPLEDVQSTPDEIVAQCQQDSYDVPQTQVSQALLPNIKDIGSDHNIEICKDLEDLESESANSIADEYQNFSSLLVLGQVSAMGTPDLKAMNKEEIDNPNDHAYEDLQSNSAPRFIINSPSLNSLFSRLVLDDFHNTGIGNLDAKVDGNVVGPNAPACEDDECLLQDMVRMASTPVEARHPNESQSSPPTRDIEFAEELITLNEIRAFPIDEASDFTFTSISLDWTYPVNEHTESFTQRHQSEIEQNPESDINSLFPLLNFYVPLLDSLESTLLLESSRSESQIPLLYSVTPFTTELSLETKMNVLHSLETSETVIGNGDDEEQGQMDFKPEPPVMFAGFLNISAEPFTQDEPNNPSDSLVAPLPYDLAINTTSERRAPLPSPLFRGESDDVVERNSTHPLSITPSLDHEGTVDTTFLDTGNPRNSATMESDEVHIPLLEVESAFSISSADAENTETSSVKITDGVHPLSMISHVEQKQMINDKVNPPNSSHEAQIKQSSTCFIHPKHSPDRPNWALAPVDLPKPQTRSAKKTTKTENKRTMSRRGKQKADDITPTGKTLQAQATNSSDQPTVKPAISANSSYMSDSPSNKSLEKLRSQSSVATSSIPRNKGQQAPTNSNAVLSARDFFVANPSIKVAALGKTHRQRDQANVSEMHTEKEQVPAKAIGSGHRARSVSVSFCQIDSSDETSILIKGNNLEPPAIEAATTVKAKETDRRPTPTIRNSSITHDTCENNTETVKDKIAAILSEMHSRKSSGVQPSRNSVAKNNSKKGSTAMQINAAPQIPVGGPQQSRVPWSCDEQEFQANGRPPLTWRAGIGKALSFHTSYTQDTQLRPPSAMSGNHNRRKPHVEDAHSHHSTVHHEYSLHARERDEPVRVNLPSQPKPSERQANQLPFDSSTARYSSSRPIFHSHIPVATRDLVNRSVGPESDAAVSAAPMSFINAEDANPPRAGHRYCTIPAPNPYLQDSIRASTNRPSVPNLPARMHNSGSRSFIPAAPGHKSQYPFSAMQRVKTREFLNNAYLQEQHRERRHVETAQSNYPVSTPFATNFYPVVGDVLEWRNGQASRPSDAVFFEDHHHRLSDISRSPSTSHGLHVPQQEMDHRNFSTYNTK